MDDCLAVKTVVCSGVYWAENLVAWKVVPLAAMWAVMWAVSMVG